MAAVALTKVEARPTGTLGAVQVHETDPAFAWYTAGTISDADTTAFTGWFGPLPAQISIVPTTTNEGCSAEFALSGSTLTLTYNGAATAGAYVGIRLA
jgi:hypothetical protein